MEVILLALALLGWFFQGLWWFGKKAWRAAYSRPSPPVRSRAQRLNRRAYEDYVTGSPVVLSMRVTRRRPRGAARKVRKNGSV